MIPVEIISNTSIAPLAYLLEFKRIFDFLPGQVIKISLNEQAPRMYSLASGNNENTIKILYDIKPGGELTPRLSNLKKGDMISISQPFGEFLCDTSPCYWIAQGTGIAPFYSMFCSGLGQGKILIQGGRKQETFYFREEFMKFFESENYICCSSLKETGNFYLGRLTDYLKKQNNLPAHLKYYLCGSAEMVIEVRDILISKNVPFGNIIAEIYF
jgi:ferredoxin/flavodoxin---NADP+ reductase